MLNYSPVPVDRRRLDRREVRLPELAPHGMEGFAVGTPGSVEQHEPLGVLHVAGEGGGGQHYREHGGSEVAGSSTG